MDLTSYRSLGRSGLAVSPLALGTMTFGTGRWGADGATSRAIYDAYVDAGGNFVDTADVYAGGTSEELLGSFIADAGTRDRIVLATKLAFRRTRANRMGVEMGPSTSAPHWMARFGGSRPITSTFIGFMSGIR